MNILSLLISFILLSYTAQAVDALDIQKEGMNFCKAIGLGFPAPQKKPIIKNIKLQSCNTERQKCLRSSEEQYERALKAAGGKDPVGYLFDDMRESDEACNRKYNECLKSSK